MKPLIYQYRVQWRELLQCVGIVPDNISSWYMRLEFV